MLDLHQEFLNISPMVSTNDRFAGAESHWDLKTMYLDLAAVKGKPLTPVEKLHLCGLLCGYSPAEIAEKLDKDAKGVETDLCATVYKYVKSLVGKGNEKIGNWRNIAELLEESGYKTKSSAKLPVPDLLPENCIVNVTNIHIDNNQIVFFLNLRIPTSPDSEIPIPNLDFNEDNTN